MPKSKITPEKIAEDIRIELRSILRQKQELSKPIGWFRLINSIPEGKPRYFVVFDKSEFRHIKGLQTNIKELGLPDEGIWDSITNFAMGVWHLKDRLHQWIKINGIKVNAESVVDDSLNLKVCADIANSKKHGRSSNRSGLSPTLSLVKFDTSNSGTIEFYYEGDIKNKILLVTNPIPIPYTVDIMINNEQGTLGNAVKYFSQASNWRGGSKEFNPGSWDFSRQATPGSNSHTTFNSSPSPSSSTEVKETMC